jgi:hypothetical protein
MPDRTPPIQNPGSHTHRPVMIRGQAICQDCGEVVIKPILSFDDERLKAAGPLDVSAAELAFNAEQGQLWIEALKDACRKKPMRLDLMLIELSERLGYEWPDYIDQLASFTKGENPPHLSDATLGEVE